MSGLTLRFLGVAEIERDGAPIHLHRRHSLALLAYLVLTRRSHSREALATLLAGDFPAASARKLLRNALADLAERGLGDYLLTSRQAVGFNTEMPHSVDVLLIDELSAAHARLDDADLDWVAGRFDLELLAGLALRDAPDFEMWLLSEREQRSQQMIALAHRQLESYLWRNQTEPGIALARRLLVVEPWHEEIHRMQMRLLARQGQVPAALAQYDRCREALALEFGVDPQPETTALFERLRSGSIAPRTNLPAPPAGTADLLGRDGELDTLTRNLVDPTCRLLTVVGIGGIGKTSLALAAAQRLAGPAPFFDEHPFADGIFLLNLADQVEPDAGSAKGVDSHRRIVTAIGFALGLVFYGRIDRGEQIIAFLRTKRVLLVVDNFEPYLDGASVLLDIMKSAPGVKFLVTSRAPLDVAEEWTLWLGGLRLPEDADDLEHAAASQLFLREARRINAAIDPAQHASVVEVCRLTGGMPLALKIVAAWSGLMTPAEIESELIHAGPLLGEPVSIDDRQPSIQTVMVASFASLQLAEQEALTRLAVFSASFDRPAAEAVGVTHVVLLALCRRSLVERDDERFALHPLVRQLAVDRLAHAGAGEAVLRSSHAAYYASFVASRSSALYQRPEAHTEIHANHSNVQAAWDWAVAQRDVELLDQLWEGLAIWSQLAGLHREWSESLALAARCIRAREPGQPETETLTRLLVSEAECLLWLGDIDRALQLIEEARTCARALDSLELEALISLCEGRLLRFRNDPRAISESLQQARVLARATHQRRIEANSLLQLSFAAVDIEHYAEADGLLERAEEAFSSLGDRLSLGRTAHHKGRLHTIRGDYTAARTELEHCLHLARTFGDRFLESSSHVYLGIVCDAGSGSHREAEDHFDRAYRIAQQTGDPYLDGIIHRSQGRNAMHVGDFSRADRHFTHALDRGRDVGNNRAVNDSLCCLARLAHLTGDWESAESRAQQALRLSSDQGRQHASASALLVLGQARERLGRLSEATAAFTQALAIANALRLPYLRADATTGLASVSLVAGDFSLAQRYVEDVLPHLREHALAGCEEPGWTTLTSVRVLQAVHDSRADDVLQAGASLLERRTAALPSPQRGRYIRAFPDRSAVVRLWLERGGAGTHAQPSSHLALSPATGEELLDVTQLLPEHPWEQVASRDGQSPASGQRHLPIHARRRRRSQRSQPPPRH